MALKIKNKKEKRKKYFSKNFKKLAFILIELMTVVAIIGLLSTVVSVSASKSRVKTRDTKRKADLATLQIALELYYDSHGTYKVADSGYAYTQQPLGGGAGWIGLENCPAVYNLADPKCYITAISRVLYNEGFLSEPFLESPVGGTRTVQVGSNFVEVQGVYGYMLYVCNSETAYSLTAYLENPTDEERMTICKSCQAKFHGSPFWGKNYAIGNYEFPAIGNCPQIY
ncbi:MAG: hypothetical protein Q8N68_00590 [bacterium]|nr:hypothetical protein [bacterium]